MAAENVKITIACKDTKVEVDRELFRKFAARVTKEKDETTFTVDCSSKIINLMIEYCEHHQKKEGPTPTGTAQLNWTVENAFEDKWDGKFFTRVLAETGDPLLRDFARAAKHFEFFGLFKKTTLVIAIGIVTRANSTKGDKLAEEFGKMALKKN
jgi:hypothetical protein